jgi:hypothetical protein
MRVPRNKATSAVGCGELANRISRERCGSFVTTSYPSSLFMGGERMGAARLVAR